MAAGEPTHGEAGSRNQRAVLREILSSGPISRTEIGARVGLTAGAVSRIVRPLLDVSLVRETTERRDDAPGRPGRRTSPLEINPRGGQVLGIGIGPSIQTVVLSDIGSGVIAGIELNPDVIDDPDLMIRRVARESRRLIGAHLDDRSRLLGGLLMITGPVDPVKGSTPGAPYLGWGPYPLRARLADVLDVPMTIRSMTATIASAELRFGVARKRKNVLTFLCGLGVGSAVILDGRLIEGGNIPTGGIGAMEVTGEDGAVTTLDRDGAGLGILLRLHGDDMSPVHETISVSAPALRAAIERDRTGDAEVAELMAMAGRGLGRVVTLFSRFAMPETVLIAGPLSMSPSYMTAIAETVERQEAMAPVEVVASTVTGPVSGWSASCAMAVWEYLIERPLDLARFHVKRE